MPQGLQRGPPLATPRGWQPQGRVRELRSQVARVRAVGWGWEGQVRAAGWGWEEVAGWGCSEKAGTQGVKLISRVDSAG